MRAKRRKGFLIYLSGIDGSGKTTQASLLHQYLIENGIDSANLWCRWEPFLVKYLIRIIKAFSLGRSKRMTVVDKSNTAFPSDVVFIRTKNRIFRFRLLRYLWRSYALKEYQIQRLRQVKSLLLKHEVVICDRYIYDMMIDIVINFGKPPSELQKITNLRTVRSFPKPNASVHICIPPEIGFERKKDGTALSYLKLRTEYYDYLSDTLGSCKVDGTLSVDGIAEKIRNFIREKVNARK